MSEIFFVTLRLLFKCDEGVVFMNLVGFVVAMVCGFCMGIDLIIKIVE